MESGSQSAAASPFVAQRQIQVQISAGSGVCHVAKYQALNFHSIFQIHLTEKRASLTHLHAGSCNLLAVPASSREGLKALYPIPARLPATWLPPSAAQR